MKNMIVLSLCTLFLSSIYAQEQTLEPWRFGLGLSLRADQTAEADIYARNLSNSQVLTGDAEFDVKTGIALEADVRYMRKNNWGFLGGLSIGLSSEVDGGKITINGTTSTSSGGSADPDEVRVSYIHANAVYRWNEFYIPFGVNFSVIDYDATGFDINADGGSGYQFGVGYLFNDNLAIEIMRVTTRFDISYTDTSNNIYIEFNEGFLTSYDLSVKYIF